MPINKIAASKRGKVGIAAAIIAAAAGGWHSTRDTSPKVLPPAVILATDKLILPWEGMELKSHWDRFAKIWDICAGLTRINGKPVQPGMSFTRPECEAMSREQIFNDYYLPLVKQVPGFTSFPISVQAAMLSGAYNFGVGSVPSRKGMAGSTATRFHMAAYAIQMKGDTAQAIADKELMKKDGDKELAAKSRVIAEAFYREAALGYRKGCEAQTAFNKAGGIIVDGLVKRREMGDAQRAGEAEICVSGL